MTGAGITVGVGVGEADGVGSTVGTGVGISAGLGFATVMPLFQTSFLPLFTQVNFLPLAVAVTPTFLQESPALTAAMALIGEANKAIEMTAPSTFLMAID
jgi:hypothetical protein